MKDVAERAGISQRGLVHHFANKQELLTAVLARHDQEVAIRVRDTGGVDALLSFVDVVTSNTARPWIVELYSILSTEAISPTHPAHAHYLQRYSTFRRYVAQSFEALRERDLLSTDLDSETLAATFTALIEGLQIQWLYDAAAIDIDRTLRAYLATVVRGVPKPV